MSKIYENCVNHIFMFERSKLLLLASFLLLSWFFVGCKDPGSNEQQTSGLYRDTVIAKPEIRFDSSLYDFENGLVKLKWDHLLNVKFTKQYSEDLGFEVDLPLFTDTLLALNGKQVIAEGFYIPVDETGDESIVILSAYPFAQCFFCGAAGAESVIDVLNIGKLPRLKLDQKIKFKGRFRLNKDNFDFLIYILEEAELIK